ncbi:MAG TPA: GNAT family protein [Dehalococcoidia bacterium]|nr:GNAT family protein [Dehalococcoidia bacterium]
MIEGKLVNLRAPEMGDLERNHRWINDRDVTQYLVMRYPISLAAEEAWMRERTARPLSYDNVFFAIETKDGVHIGNINFFNTSAEDRKTELGIMIGEKAYWSNGYGSDALRLMLRFAFEEMNLNRVQLDVYAENARARAAYRKVGFVEEGTRRRARYQQGAYQDVVVMAVLRDEWAR